METVKRLVEINSRLRPPFLPRLTVEDGVNERARLP